MSEDDLTGRIAGLAARIEAGAARDEALAQALAGEEWHADTEVGDEYNVAVVCAPGGGQVVRCGVEILQDGELLAAHIARHDPRRALRRAKAVRDLAAEILAFGHYNDESGYNSCSQAREVHYSGWTKTGEGPPGSGCSDRERAGQPCDCGRDERVARILGVIAGEWEANGLMRTC